MNLRRHLQFNLIWLLLAVGLLSIVLSAIHYLGIAGAVILGYLLAPHLLLPKLLR